jgi:tRNA(adenine34) deaminase
MAVSKKLETKSSAQKPGPKKQWIKRVKTDSTHPGAGLFTKDAETIARELASKKVSPKGPASGMRMLNYFINRGGHGLTEERKNELEKAKQLLSERIRKVREKHEHSTKKAQRA